MPFLPRPVDMGDADQWHGWLVHDQRFVDGRTDVLSYTSAPLTKPVHIMGPPKVDLFAATSGTDSDWVVKLIDVYPNEIPEGARRDRSATWPASSCRSESRSSAAAMSTASRSRTR